MPFMFAVWALNCWTNCPMFTPCWPRAGPMGGAGVACPPGACSLIVAVISFATAQTPFADRSRSDPLQLPVFDLDRGRPAKDLDDERDHAALLVDAVHLAFEVLEAA